MERSQQPEAASAAASTPSLRSTDSRVPSALPSHALFTSPLLLPSSTLTSTSPYRPFVKRRPISHTTTLPLASDHKMTHIRASRLHHVQGAGTLPPISLPTRDASEVRGSATSRRLSVIAGASASSNPSDSVPAKADAYRANAAQVTATLTMPAINPAIVSHPTLHISSAKRAATKQKNIERLTGHATPPALPLNCSASFTRTGTLKPQPRSTAFSETADDPYSQAHDFNDHNSHVEHHRIDDTANDTQNDNSAKYTNARDCNNTDFVVVVAGGDNDDDAVYVSPKTSGGHNDNENGSACDDKNEICNNGYNGNNNNDNNNISDNNSADDDTRALFVEKSDETELDSAGSFLTVKSDDEPTTPTATMDASVSVLPVQSEFRVRRALLIACEYRTTSMVALRASTRNALRMRSVLINSFGWHPDDIRVLSDRCDPKIFGPASKAAIIRELDEIASFVVRDLSSLSASVSSSSSSSSTQVFLYYTGFACEKMSIVPEDFRKSGSIFFREIRDRLISNAPPSASIRMVFDPVPSPDCVSAFDFALACGGSSEPQETSAKVYLPFKATSANVIALEASPTTQYGSDDGALTDALVQVWHENAYCVSIAQLLTRLTTLMGIIDPTRQVALLVGNTRVSGSELFEP